MDSTFTKSTDTREKIKLKSNLIYALWTYKQAHAGQYAAFEVRTSLVGNGARIKVTCWTESGKKLDKIEGAVYNNKYTGNLLIPRNCKSNELIYFEVELPKHGLKDESNSIPVRPVIQVSKIQWDRKEVKREDVVMLSCQFQCGVEDGEEATVVIYEHNPNSCDLKVVSIPTVIKDNKIEIQWKFDYQDDTLQIPTQAELQKYKTNYHTPDFFFVVVVDGIRIGINRESGLMQFLDTIDLKYTEFNRTPVPNAEYKICLADGNIVEGKLSANGCANLKNIIPGPYSVEYFEDTQNGTQSPRLAIVKSEGKTGTQTITVKPVIIAAIDSHMHIQSGHVGTLPFALGAVYPLGIRKMTYDIPNKMFYEKFKREYLDEDTVELYQNYQSIMGDISIKTDILSKKYKSKTGHTAEFRKDIQNEIIDVAASLCKLLHRMSVNYSKLIDLEQKTVINLVSENIGTLERKANAGELILSTADAHAKNASAAVDNKFAEAQRKADKITGIVLNIATYIVDFQLSFFSGFCDFSTTAIKTVKEILVNVYKNILELMLYFTNCEKESVTLIEQELIKILMESAPRIARFGTISLALLEMWQKAKSFLMAQISEFAHEKSNIGLVEFLTVQKEKTYGIGGKAVNGSDSSTMLICHEYGAKTPDVFAPVIVMPMDLDFAHLDRFEQDISKAVVYRYANTRYWWNMTSEYSGPDGKLIETKHKVLLPPEISQTEIQNIRKSDTVDVEKGDFYYFNNRLSGTKPGQLFWLHPSEYKAYEHWSIQRKDTITAVKNHPWRVVPLYHFEPRRYSGNCEEAFQYIMDKNSTSGNSKEPRVFIGIKVYPNLGYKPLDERLPALATMYQRCIDNDIPIMTHGSPNGAFTHDRPLYYDYDLNKKTNMTVANNELGSLKGEEKSLYYFMQEYASPHAWEQVLKKYNKLRLCIAHFGGSDNRPDSTDKNEIPLSGWNVAIDQNANSWNETCWNQKIISMMHTYVNLYTDLSCMQKEEYIENLPGAIIRWPELRKRIMFGTDWYMTERDNLPYKVFVEQAKEGIDYVDSIVRKSGKISKNDPTLWQWFTEINPFRFYRFDRIAKEYTLELIKAIDTIPEIKADLKVEKKDRARNLQNIVYTIAKRLQTIKELPDAITYE